MGKPSFQEVLQAAKEVTGNPGEAIVSRGRRKEVMMARGVLIGVWRALGYRLMDWQRWFRRGLSVLSRWSRIPDQAGAWRVNAARAAEVPGKPVSLAAHQRRSYPPLLRQIPSPPQSRHRETVASVPSSSSSVMPIRPHPPHPPAHA